MAEKAFAPLAGRDRVNEIGSAVSNVWNILLTSKFFFFLFIYIYFKQNYL